MARGVTLGELTTQLRLAARYDPNPALSIHTLPMMQQALRDTQERLYDEFDWPFLKVPADKTLAAGQRYYDIPANLNLERIISVDVRYSLKWNPVERGIDLNHYNARDSDSNEREDPVRRWDVVHTGAGAQIEVWPIPATNGDLLRFRGIRKLTPLIATSDLADLDDQMIVLFAAGELLGGANSPAAQIKFTQAKKRMETLQGRVTKRRSNGFVLGGAPRDDCEDSRPRVAYARAV